MASAIDREEVRQLLKRISDAWRTGQPGKLHEYFHEDMVIVGPGYREMGTGREACVQSYEEFLRNATIQEYKESEPVVRAWGNTAIATYDWEMAYEMNGRAGREVGTDLFVFGRENDRWVAIWRAIHFGPKAS
jgi:uncharacterized protein (TIGR02246 family)